MNKLYIYNKKELKYEPYKKRFNILIPLLTIIVFLTTISSKPDVIRIPKEIKKVEIVTLTDSTPLTEKNVWNFIKKCNIKFPEVVFAQAMVETGHLNSKICIESNNLFGFRTFPSARYEKTYHLKNIKNRGHLIFPTWKHSVLHYVEFQKTNFDKKHNNYYDFLEKQGYAEAPNYIQVLKTVKIPEL